MEAMVLLWLLLASLLDLPAEAPSPELSSFMRGGGGKRSRPKPKRSPLQAFLGGSASEAGAGAAAEPVVQAGPSDELIQTVDRAQQAAGAARGDYFASLETLRRQLAESAAESEQRRLTPEQVLDLVDSLGMPLRRPPAKAMAAHPDGTFHPAEVEGWWKEQWMQRSWVARGTCIRDSPAGARAPRLSVRSGDALGVLNRTHPEWWLCASESREGWLPASAVRIDQNLTQPDGAVSSRRPCRLRVGCDACVGDPLCRWCSHPRQCLDARALADDGSHPLCPLQPPRSSCLDFNLKHERDRFVRPCSRPASGSEPPDEAAGCCGDGVCQGEDDQSCPEDCVLGSSAERALPQKLSPGTIRRADSHQENLRER